MAGKMITLSPQNISLVQDKYAVLRRVQELIRNGVSKYGKESRAVRLWMRAQKRLFHKNKDTLSSNTS